uniref:Uncharacterized protein n=1 Tax=Sipha flava TaxID=143950 RepID=A0A2S2R6G2_9HEMI
MRTNINENFKEIFNKSEQLFISVNEEEKIKIPRLVSRSTNRINVDTKIPEDYFRIAIAIPFYDDFISQLKERFSKHKTILSSLYLLIPNMCLKSPILESDFSIYSDFINVDITFRTKIVEKKIDCFQRCRSSTYSCRSTKSL